MEDQTTIKYLDLSIINQLETPKDAQLRYTGGNFLTNQTKVLCYKFLLNTSNYPKYLPTIVTSFIPHKIDSQTVSVTSPEGIYMTDLTISLFGTKMDNSTVNITAPVYFYPTSGSVNQSYSGIITDSFFWVKNSDQFCDMINRTFDLLTESSSAIMIGAIEERWCVFTKMDYRNSFKSLSIYFNDNLAPLFEFNYGSKNEILLNSLQYTSLGGSTYCQIITPTTNNRLFPFTRLVLVGHSLPVNAVTHQITADMSIATTAPVILSYDLLIDNISVLGNYISYVTDTDVRENSLANNVLQDFQIVPYLVTRNNDMFPIQLKRNDSFHVSLKFY